MMRFRIHYAWIILAVTFLVLLFAAGARTLPTILIKPLEAEFGWDRGSISFAVAICLLDVGCWAHRRRRVSFFSCPR